MTPLIVSFVGLLLLAFLIKGVAYRIQSPSLPRLLIGKVYPVDGDGFWLGRHMIRLWGMDAPELHQIHKDQPVGRLAKRHLQSLVRRGKVSCRPMGRDPYQRLVCRCTNHLGQDLSQAMIRAGWAIDLPDFSGGQYADLQKEARRAGRGMWQYGKEMDNPRLWRDQKG